MKPVIPDAVLGQHVALLGKTRSGKSSVMRGLAEGLLEREQPVCIVDPKGDWWGIKLSRDGKRPGYPLVIFGGEHADVPINEHAGAHVAELFATGNRPCLIDLGGWMPGARTRFWVEFASSLFRHTTGLRWLFVDEIHNFAPKGKVMDPESGKALHWANRLASEGLGKGVHMVFASQRPQKVHNDTLTSAETLIAMRVLHPADRGAVSDWIKGCGDLELGNKVLNSLADMKRGEGWAWSPEIGFGPERVQFPLFKTYDSFKPQSAEDLGSLKGWAEVDLEDVKAKLATVVQEAEKKDPAKLQARIRELEAAARKGTASIETRSAAHGESFSKENLRAEYQRGHVEGYNKAVAEAKRLAGRIAAAEEQLAQVRIGLERDLVAPPPAWGASIVSHPRVRQAQVAVNHHARKAVDGLHFPPGELAVMRAVAMYEQGVEREQLSVLTGYKRSARDTYISRLTGKGFLASSGPNLVATHEGIKALGSNYEPLPTGSALRDYWMGKLPDGERRIFQALVDVYPKELDRGELSAQTGYKRSSRDTYLSRLKARRVIDVTGDGVKASDGLFQ